GSRPQQGKAPRAVVPVRRCVRFPGGQVAMCRQSKHASGIMTISLVVSLALALSNLATQAVDTPADTAFYAVSYVEVSASSRSAALAAFKQYRGATQHLPGPPGFVRLDTFEQIGRPGPFALIETWGGQKVFAPPARAIKT